MKRIENGDGLNNVLEWGVLDTVTTLVISMEGTKSKHKRESHLFPALGTLE